MAAPACPGAGEKARAAWERCVGQGEAGAGPYPDVEGRRRDLVEFFERKGRINLRRPVQNGRADFFERKGGTGIGFSSRRDVLVPQNVRELVGRGETAGEVEGPFELEGGVGVPVSRRVLVLMAPRRASPSGTVAPYQVRNAPPDRTRRPALAISTPIEQPLRPECPAQRL